MPTYLMRYSEIYMMKAECEARTGKGDPLATLNALRSGHGLPAITGVTDILQTIYQEWILEMGFENGHEWWLKKWLLPPIPNCIKPICLINGFIRFLRAKSMPIS